MKKKITLFDIGLSDEKNLTEELRRHVRDYQLNFRISKADFEEIKEITNSMQVSISDYFLTLHKLAMKLLNEKA